MWMRIDDGLHNHRKTRAVVRSEGSKVRDAAPMGLWVLAGSWAAQNNRDGWVPEDELDRWDDDWRALAARLVRAGYWWPHETDGEPGYGFTDWHDYNDPGDLASKSGTYGNHVRWHVNEGRVEPECDHCPNEPNPDIIAPESPPESGAMAAERGVSPQTNPTLSRSVPPNVDEPDALTLNHRGDIGGDSPPESQLVSGAIALPKPVPSPDPSPSPLVPALPDRDDVERICQHMANRVETNGSKRPKVTKAWRDAARLMLDNDKRSEEQIHAAIDWCQNDDFWKGVVMALPKLRKQYDAMRLQAQRPALRSKQQQTDDIFDNAARRMGIIQGGQQ